MGINPALAAAIAKSSANKNGTWLKPDGKYELEIQKVLMEDKTKGATFIVEFKVLKSEATKPGATVNAPGTSASYVVIMSQQSGPGNVKAFLMHALGVPEEACDVQAIVEACSDAQPLRFFRILDETYEKPQKQDKTKMFTYHNWQHVDPDEAEFGQVMERRKQADAEAAAGTKK